MARKKPFFLIRLLLQLVSLILCLLLTVSVLATALLLDFRTLTSSGGIEAVLSAFFSSGSSDPGPSTDAPYSSNAEDGYLVRLNSSTNLPDNIQIPDNIELPNDALTDSNVLADYIVDILEASMGEDVQISQEQVQDFIDNSTIMDYTSEKMASYVQDALNGETNTVITADEIMQLLEDNQKLIEDTFQVEITEDIKQEIRTNVTKVIEEEDLNGTIRKEIDSVMQQPVAGDYTIEDIVLLIGQITQTKVLLAAIGLCLLLIALLFLANYYNPGKALRWAATSFLTVGLPLAAGAYILQSTSLLQQLFGSEIGKYISVLTNLGTVLAPVHYGIAILGVLMLVGSIVWRILSKLLPKRRKKVKKQVEEPATEAMTPLVLDEVSPEAEADEAAKIQAEPVPSEIEPLEIPVEVEPLSEEAPEAEIPEAVEADQSPAPAEEEVPEPQI